MCNQYAMTAPAERLRRFFEIEADDDATGNLPPLPATFPRYDAPVVRQDDLGRRSLSLMHWGFLLPQRSKRNGQPIMPKAINNARDDKLRSSPFWRESFEQRRCLAPATSFCEAKGRSPAVYHWFGIDGDEDRPLFAFAALWRRWRGAYRGESVDIETYTIVTTRPNELVREIHPDRMPVILAPEDHDVWINGSPGDAAELLRPYPADRMRIVRAGEGEKADPLGR